MPSFTGIEASRQGWGCLSIKARLLAKSTTHSILMYADCEKMVYESEISLPVNKNKPKKPNLRLYAGLY